MMTTTHTFGPWSYQYAPYLGQNDHEIPAFEIFDAEGNKILDTNENAPVETQQHVASLASAAPEMLEALQVVASYLDKLDDENLVDRVNRAIARAMP